ncbi:hypothetical protein MKX01_016146 [Papaver californicum]|nr:hypothetical protein MKX01_016146 [Papaver californicum]
MARRDGRDEEENSHRASMLSSTSSRRRAMTDPFLLVCKCFSFFVSLTAILCIFVNILSAFKSFKNGSDIFDGVFRCYAVVIAVFVVVAEIECRFILSFWRVLEYWAGRGMLQIFVAVMTRAFPDVNGARKDLILLQEVSSYLLLACGLTYLISGVLCIGFLKRARQSKEITRIQAVKDLEESERRKGELEALLAMERA